MPSSQFTAKPTQFISILGDQIDFLLLVVKPKFLTL